ncbi:MAG TPA: hypothetical protein VFE33_33425 [Thermoanaerobaculia bacterium]|nr:hypothetical protein [Thermoanaerobaculia bacterium]
MTAEELQSLLALLDPDRERAAERYETLRRRLIRLFEWWGCATPEDLTDVTFDRVAHKTAQQGFRLEKPDPFHYICTFARFVYLEDLRKRKEVQSSGDEPSELVYPVPPDPDPPDSRLPCFLRCLDVLSSSERRLLFDFHPDLERIRSRHQLAERLGITDNALRIKVHRVSRRLKECMAGCLKKEDR